MVPDRAPPFVEAAVKWTVPLPLPLPPDVMVIHPSLVPAVHPQPAPLATSKLPLPPDAPTFAADDESEKEQPLP